MPEYVNLANMDGGAADELFAAQLQKVIENIKDVNTKADAKRTIILKVELTPGSDRETASVKYSAESKLAPPYTRETRFYLGNDPKTGEFVAAESNPKQMTLGGLIDAAKAENVVNMNVIPGGR